MIRSTQNIPKCIDAADVSREVEEGEIVEDMKIARTPNQNIIHGRNHNHNPTKGQQPRNFNFNTIRRKNQRIRARARARAAATNLNLNHISNLASMTLNDTNSNNFATNQRIKNLAEIEAKTQKKNSTICVYGLSACTTNPDKLNGHFSRCGSIFNISILHKPSFENGREGIRDGIAKIKFFDKTSAAAAILDWNGREWFGGKLHLEWWSISKENMIRQGNSYWREETNKSEQKEKDRQNLLENATTSKASDEYENELRPLEVQIPQIDVNANMNASGSSGTDNSSFVRQLMAGSSKGGGVFLPKTRHWIPQMPSSLLAEIGNVDEDDFELDEFSKTMKDFSENLPARNDLSTVERVSVMQLLLEGLTMKSNATMALMDKDK